MARSPIEMMIDQACGYTPRATPKPVIVLALCPMCKEQKDVPRQDFMPDGAEVMLETCATCDPTSSVPISFHRRNGDEVSTLRESPRR